MADNLPVSLQTGFDLNTEYQFKADTQARLDRILPSQGAPAIQYPTYQREQQPTVNNLLNGEGPFDIKAAFFSDDPKQRALADEALSRRMGQNLEYQLGVNNPNFYEYDKSMEKYLQGEKGMFLNRRRAENEDMYARDQTTLGNIGNFLGRTLAGTGYKFGESVGYLGSAINPFNWNSEFFTNVADNAMSRYLEDAEQSFKDTVLPVYHSLDYDKKGIFSKMADSSWWADSASDGAAFMLSAMIPGVGLSKLGNAAKIAGNAGKVAKFLTGADTVGGIGSFAINVTSESFFEAAGARKEYIEQQKDLRKQGLIDKTDEQINGEAGKVARNSFLGNLALLSLGPTQFENRMIFGKLAGNVATQAERRLIPSLGEDLLASIRKPMGRLNKTFDFSQTGRLGFYGGKVLTATGVEGLWEENAQLAIERIATGNSNLSFANQYIQQTYNALSGNDPELAESIALGGILGSTGVIVGSRPLTKKSERRELKADYNKAQAVAENLNSARSNWLTLNDAYEKDANGSIKFDTNGEPVMNQATLTGKAKALETFKNLQDQIDSIQDPDLRQLMSKGLMTDYIKTTLDSGVFDQFINRMQNFSSKSAEEIQQMGLDPETVRNNPDSIVEYAQVVAQVYESIKNDDRIAPAHKSQIVDKIVQNINLDEYTRNLQTRSQDFIGQVRTLENATLSDLYAEQHNNLEFRVQALEQSNAQMPTKFKADEIKRLKAEQESIAADNEDNKDDLKLTDDNFYIKDDFLSNPSYSDYLYNEKKKAEIENVIADNQNAVVQLASPNAETYTREAASNAVNQSPVLNPPAATVKTEPTNVPNVTPEQFEEFVNTGEVAPEVTDNIAEKVAAQEPLTPQEADIYSAKGEEIERKVRQRKLKDVIEPVVVVETSPTAALPIDPLPKRNREYDSKGAVAYKTPLKTVTQESIFDQGEEVSKSNGYETWVQSYISTFKIADHVGTYPEKGQYKLFYMRDSDAWPYNKSADYESRKNDLGGKLGAVIVVTDLEGDPVYFDADYNPTTKEKGRVISFSADTSYINRDINRKAEVGAQKGIIVNGKYVKLKDADTVRKSYIAINDQLIRRRNDIVANDTKQELVLTTVEANNGVPVGEVRNAQEVFGENPQMQIINGTMVMTVEGHQFQVTPTTFGSNPDLLENVVGLYGHTYSKVETAEGVAAYLGNILPSKGMPSIAVVQDGARYRLEAKINGAVKTADELRKHLNRNSRPPQIKVIPNADLSSDFTSYTIKGNKVTPNTTTYGEYLKDKFKTDLAGTRTLNGRTYRPLNAYFNFEFADQVAQPIPDEMVAPLPTEPKTVVVDTEKATVISKTTKAQPAENPVVETPKKRGRPKKEVVNTADGNAKVTPAEDLPEILQPVAPVITETPETVAPPVTPQAATENKPTVRVIKREKPITPPAQTAAEVVEDRYPTGRPRNAPLALISFRDSGKNYSNISAYIDPVLIKFTVRPANLSYKIEDLPENSLFKKAIVKLYTQTNDIIKGDLWVDLRGMSYDDIINRAGLESETLTTMNNPNSTLSGETPSYLRVKQEESATFKIYADQNVKDMIGTSEPLRAAIRNKYVQQANQNKGLDHIDLRGQTTEDIIGSVKLQLISEAGVERFLLSDPEVFSKYGTYLSFLERAEENPNYPSSLENDPEMAQAAYEIFQQTGFFMDENGETFYETNPNGITIENYNTQKATSKAIYDQSDRYEVAELSEINKQILTFKDSLRRFFGKDIEVITDPERIDEIKMNDPLFQRKDNLVVAGFYSPHMGILVIDPRVAAPTTAIHEFTHLWNDILMDQNPEFYQRGLELVKGTIYEQEVREMYPEISDEENILEEALTRAVEDKAKKLKENEGLIGWLKDLWNWISGKLGLNMDGDELQNLTLSDYTDIVAGSLLYSEQVDPELKRKDVTVSKGTNNDWVVKNGDAPIGTIYYDRTFSAWADRDSSAIVGYTKEEAIKTVIDAFNIQSQNNATQQPDFRQEMISEALSLKDQVAPLYNPLITEDYIEDVLKEAAFQANSSEAEKRGATSVFGERFVEIAQVLYPNERPESDIHMQLRKTNAEEDVEDLTEEDAPVEQSQDTKKKLSNNFEEVSDILQKHGLFDEVMAKLPDFYKAVQNLQANSDLIKSNKARILNSLSNIRSNEGKIRTLLDTISTTNKLLETMSNDFTKALKNEDVNERLLQTFNIYNASKSFDDVIQLIKDVKTQLSLYETSDFKNNYVKINNLLDDSVRYHEKIKNGFIQALLPDVAKILGEKSDLYGDIRQRKEKLEKEIADLNSKLNSGNQREKNRISLLINRAKQQLAELPTEESFMSALKGNAEDINGLVYSVVSRADSTSNLVQSAQLIADESNFRTNQETQAKANDISKRYDTFLNTIGLSKSNPEEVFGRLIKQSEVVDSFKEDGTYTSHKQDILLNEASPEFFADRDRLIKRVQTLDELIGKEENIDKKKDLRREKEQAELERDEFIRNYTAAQIPAQQFEISKLLKEDIGGGHSVNELTNGIFDRIVKLSISVGNNGSGFGLKEQTNQLSYQYRKLNDYLNGLSQPQDSVEYKIADRLRKAITLRDQIGYFSMKAEAEKSFNSTLSWKADKFRKTGDDQALFDWLQRNADLNNDINEAEIEKLMIAKDKDAGTGTGYQDAFLQLQDILEDVKDENGLYDGKKSVDLARVRALDTLVMEVLEEDPTRFHRIPTPYYKDVLADKINEYTQTIRLEYATEEQARKAAETRIKETQWFKDNHIGSRPMAQWVTIFGQDANNAVRVANSFKPGRGYYSYQIYDKYQDKGRKEGVGGVDNGKYYINDDVNNKYRDKDYDKLMKATNPTDKAYAEFLTWYTNDYFASQGNYKQTSRNGYKLPSVRKSGLERNIVSAPIDTLKRMVADTSLNEQESEQMYGGINKIPVRYSNRIDTVDQTKDLIGSLLTYDHFARRYTNMQQIEPLLVGVKDMIEANGTIKTNYTKSGIMNAVTGFWGALKAKEQLNKASQGQIKQTGESNISKSLDLVIKEELYGKYNEEFEIPIMGGVDGNNLARHIMKLSSFGTFVGNIMSPLKNAVGGQVQSLIFARGVEAGVYTFGDTLKAKATFAMAHPDFARDATKFGDKSVISQIIDRMGLLQGEITDEFGKQTQWSAWKMGTNWLTFFKNYAEFQIQTEQALAFLHAKKVKQGDKTISLLDAWEKDQSGNIKLKDGVEFPKKEEFAFSEKVKFFQRQMNGAYRTSEKNALQRNPLGKMLFFMNQYFVPMFNARFRPEYYNLQKGNTEEGFYLGFARFLRDTLVDYKGNVLKSWSDMSADQKDQVAKTVKELAIISALFLGATALGYGGDADRRKRNSDMENYMLGLMTGSYAEARSFIFPSDYYNKVNNPFFVFRPLNTMMTLVDDTGLTLVGSEDAYFKKDQAYWQKGDSKAIADALKLIGFTGSQLNPENYAKVTEQALKLRN